MQGLRQDGKLLQNLQYVVVYLLRPEGYSIDQKTVREMARDLQKEFHPDKFNESGSSSLQEKMALYSTYINEAKATLLNDLQRAIYLMELQGVHL